jgi:hypothetical protein
MSKTDIQVEGTYKAKERQICVTVRWDTEGHTQRERERESK